MTRDQLLARRLVLARLYQNPDPSHELQHVEVETELDWIAERLKGMPREAPKKPLKWERR